MVRRKYRSQAGIILDILEALHRDGPMPPTRLSYYANIPYDRLRLILRELANKELVTYVPGERLVEITGKGLEALLVLRRSRKLLESLGFRF